MRRIILSLCLLACFLFYSCNHHRTNTRSKIYNHSKSPTVGHPNLEEPVIRKDPFFLHNPEIQPHHRPPRPVDDESDEDLAEEL